MKERLYVNENCVADYLSTPSHYSSNLTINVILVLDCCNLNGLSKWDWKIKNMMVVNILLAYPQIAQKCQFANEYLRHKLEQP